MWGRKEGKRIRNRVDEGERRHIKSSERCGMGKKTKEKMRKEGGIAIGMEWEVKWGIRKTSWTE